MQTKVDIISGFLGAGKTTLIKKLLEENLNSENIIVIENEFGEVGIDGSILKGSNIEVKEINSGCICCTLVGEFESAIEEVAERYKPERIIIEPSGVGKLSDIIKACESRKLKDIIAINMIITVVDALKYQIYISNFSEFYGNQIKHAKTIILSRTQNADSKKVEAAVDSLRNINPNARIVTTPWDKLQDGFILKVAEEDASILFDEQMTKSIHIHSKNCKCGCNGSHTHTHCNNADDVFNVWGTETPKKFDENELNGILGMLEKEKSIGLILRGKGILQLTTDKWVQFDYTPGELNIKETSANYTGRLCIIGRDLKKQELGKLFGISA